MTALAGLFKSKGYQVKGSDQDVYPPMSDFLQEMGIEIFHGFDESHLNPAPDLVVIGNAMSRGNPEVEAVLERKLLYTSLPEALKEFFIRGHYSCVVSGTHGKTTTSSLLAWVLEVAGRDPGFFIGGIPENFGRGYNLGNGEVFVLEGDEYDSAFFDKSSKFLHYLPDLVILNNIEFDHADIFRNLEDIEIAFRRLIRLIPRNGYLIACWDDPRVRNVCQTVYSHLETFGLNHLSEWMARDLQTDHEGTSFKVFYKDKFELEAFVPLFGEHMVRNALGVIVAAKVLDVGTEDLLNGLRTFKNVRRRLQLIGQVEDIKIFDDFAHHPSEVKATISGLKRRFPDQRLWAIFEPRTATSKRKVFENKYIEAFLMADRVILTPLHRPDKVPESERLQVEKVVTGLAHKKIPAWILPADQQMLNFLKNEINSEDIILFMSNGDFNQLPKKLVEELKGSENYVNEKRTPKE